MRRTGLPTWPYDPGLRGTSALLPASTAELSLDGGADGPVRMIRIGMVELPLPDVPRVDVWQLAQYGGGLFLPLRDATAGQGSYGGGRYLLDTAKGADLGAAADGRLVIDLNFLYHPSCRYDPVWVCPLAQPGNRVPVRVEAGERMP